MKYRNILLLFLLALASTVSAKVVSQAEALQVATTFFNSGNDVRTLSGTLALKEIWNSNSLLQGDISLLSNEPPTFYVFAPETGEGFVVVSAEDAVTPILGYSFEDEAPEGKLPCNLRLWFEATHNHISQMRFEGTTATEETLQQWARASVGSSVLLLETAQWNQDSPYNSQCPKDGNSQSVTGCVSTATAIVMRYYQYPDRGTGVADAYTTSTRGIYVDSRSLEHEYNWSIMPLEDMSIPTVSFEPYPFSDEQVYEVSTLMADIGHLLQADYTSDETGTVTNGTQNAKLYEHFGYSPNMYWLDCEEFYSKEWHNILKDEMNSHGPVIYTSFGHMFILDGYTDDDYFHINWGWGGSSNGYFLLSDLEALEDNRALVNFYPHDGSEPESTLRMCVPGMVANTENFASGNSFLITDVYIENASTIDFSGSMRFALADKDGNVKEWISNSMSLSLSPGVYTLRTSVSCTIKEEIKAGDRIRLYYQDSGSEEWKLLTSNTSKCQWEIVIEVPADLDVPEAKEASDVDAQGRTFTAHWSAVDGASGYQVMLTQIVPEDNPWDHTLIEESFDKCYSAALNTGNDISNNLDNYLSSTGWTGQYLYTSPDYLHIGNGSDEGFVQTPLLDAPSESAATVCLNFSFSSGGSNAIRIEILNQRGAGQAVTLTYTQSQAHDYNYILHVLNWSSEMYVGVHSTNVNLNGLYVFDGIYSEDDFELDQSNNIESTFYTTDTSYTFTGLEDAEYTYKVRAFSAEGSSDWSNTIMVDLTYAPPTVQTYEATDITYNSATLNGSVTAGTESITEQGFEYWSDGGDVLTVTASGEEMSVTLRGLTPNTTYTYRAYVKTASGTTYGDSMTFSTLFDMEGACAEMTAEIEAMREKLTNSWSEIAVDYADVANEFNDTYNTISTSLDELLQRVMDSYNTASINEEIMEEVRQGLATISQEIDDMLDKAKQAEKDYIDGLYAMLVAEVEATDMDLSDAWTTIETEYPDMVDDLQTAHDKIVAKIEAVMTEIAEAYAAGELASEKATKIREELAAIEQEIEEMLNCASQYTSVAGMRYDCGDDERVYDIAGSRVHRFERGNVYIFRYSDGTARKVLVK